MSVPRLPARSDATERSIEGPTRHEAGGTQSERGFCVLRVVVGGQDHSPASCVGRRLRSRRPRADCEDLEAAAFQINCTLRVLASSSRLQWSNIVKSSAKTGGLKPPIAPTCANDLQT